MVLVQVLVILQCVQYCYSMWNNKYPFSSLSPAQWQHGDWTASSLAIRDYTQQSQEDQNAKNTQRDLPLVYQGQDNLVKVLPVSHPHTSHAPMTLSTPSGLIPHMENTHTHMAC